jgi:hypothetical protein
VNPLIQEPTDLESVVVVTFEGEYDNGTSDTIDWSIAQKQVVTIDVNKTLTFLPPPGVGNFLLRIVQTSNKNITWPASIKWAGGLALNISNGAGKIDIASFYWNGTNYYATSSKNFS